jgi:hypothetical protein
LTHQNYEFENKESKTMLIKQDTNEEYHAHEFIGSSTAVSGYDPISQELNLAKIKVYIDKQKNISASLQKAFDYGSVQHEAILEQSIANVTMLPDFMTTPSVTKKAQEEEWKNDNLLPIVSTDSLGEVTETDSELTVKDMPKFSPIPSITIKDKVAEFKAKHKTKYYLKKNDYYSVLKSFDVVASHSEASRIISNATHIETSFYDDSTERKCRPDIVGKTDCGDVYVCNYKTSKDISKAHSDIFFHSYDIRALHELKIIEKALDVEVKHYFFLFQDKTAPYSLRCIELSDIDLKSANDVHQRVCTTTQQAIKSQYFPQPEFKIEQSKINRREIESAGF